LNNNFVILGIEGALSMLNGEGCQELARLRDLAGFRDAAVLEYVPEMCISWWDEMFKSGGNLMACLRLFVNLRKPTMKL
jgi:hypothetical protein